MRRFALPVVLLAALGSTPAGAVDLSGRLGLLYDRAETWTPTTHALTPRLQLDGSAQASGPVVDLGSWRGALGYQRLRRTSPGSEDSTNALTYSGQLSLLDARTAPVSLSLSADRVATDSAVATGDVRITGTRLDSSYGGQLNLNSRVLPSLSVGGWLRDSTSDGFATARTTEATKLLDVAAAHSPGPYDVRLAYQGRWNAGSVDILDYTSQTLDLNASAQLGGGTDAFLTGRYHLRLPEILAGTNPRFEQNHMVAGVRLLTPSDRGRAQYAYDHLFFTSLLTGERERIRQSLSASREIVHSATWETVWPANLTLNQERANGLEDSAYGASTGPLLRWRGRAPNRELLAEAGPVLGVLKPTDASSRLGTGAHWRGYAAWTRMFRYSLAYNGDYGRNLDATRGWSLSQAVTGDVEGPLWAGRGSTALTVSATRMNADFFGANAARDVVLTSSLAWRRLSLRLDAGLRDGTSSAVGGVSGDALFIPSAFDSHSQFAALSATALLAPRLSATARTRYARISGPELPDQEEASLLGALQYAFGEVQLALEERYTAGGPSSFDRRINEVFVRVSRTFDARF
jgi:hypothetical protein